MKNAVVKPRSGYHARLLAKRLLSSKSRNFSRFMDNVSTTNENSLVDVHSAGSNTDIVPFDHHQILAAGAGETASTTKDAQPTPRSTHPHASATTTIASNKTPASSVSIAATATTSAKSSESHVSGAAMGLAFGLIGLALLVIVAVWAIRRKQIKDGNGVPLWKRNPFADVSGLTSDTNAHVSNFGFPQHASKKSEGYLRLSDEKSIPSPAREIGPIHTDAHSSFQAQSTLITTLPATLNNPSRPKSLVALSSNSTAQQQEVAKVVRSFLPTLPDELQIHQGESIEILSSFDDGWALCQNQHDERGVVPLECLARNSGKDELRPQGGDRSQLRLSKRASSLYAGVSPNSY